MFSTEFNFDETCITLLDEHDTFEDVKIHFLDDVVVIRQWDDLIDAYQEIVMWAYQWNEMLASLNTSEGLYVMNSSAS